MIVEKKQFWSFQILILKFVLVIKKDHFFWKADLYITVDQQSCKNAASHNGNQCSIYACWEIITNIGVADGDIMSYHPQSQFGSPG